MNNKKTDPKLSLVAGLMGAKGGKARTPKKQKSSRRNIQKAIAARWKPQPA